MPRHAADALPAVHARHTAHVAATADDAGSVVVPADPDSHRVPRLSARQRAGRHPGTPRGHGQEDRELSLDHVRRGPGVRHPDCRRPITDGLALSR